MLRFENLCAGYDCGERLHSLTASVCSGRLTAVIGPNGCGKSTLMKCLAGILRPSDGEVLLNGRPLHDFSEKERARLISYLPQSRTIPEITVRQLVAHGRYPHMRWGQNPYASDRAIIESAIARTELLPLADRSVRLLSGGERQRAYLAMMLAQQTPMMMLDEPTTYLDLSAQFSLMALLRDLCREGYGAAVVLHDLALALEYADDVLLMQDGRLIAQGAPEEVYRSGALEAVFGIDAVRLENGKYLFSRKSEEP